MSDEQMSEFLALEKCSTIKQDERTRLKVFVMTYIGFFSFSMKNAGKETLNNYVLQYKNM